MKIVTEIDDCVKLLDNFKGAKAQVWAFNVSLKRMLIKLSRNDSPKLLFIIILGCEYMKGPFIWKNAIIEISKSKNQNTGEETSRMSDKNVQFEIISSGGISLAAGLEEDFTNSFINFSE